MKHKVTALNRSMRRRNEEESYLMQLSDFLRFSARQKMKVDEGGNMNYQDPGLTSQIGFTPAGMGTVNVKVGDQVYQLPFIPTYNLSIDKARLESMLAQVVRGARVKYSSDPDL